MPGNSLLAEPMYLAGYIERMGTGTRDMIRRCAEAGLAEPEFAVTDGFVIRMQRTAKPVAGRATPEVTPEVVRLVVALEGEMSRAELLAALELRDEKHFRERYLQMGLEAGAIEMTRPDRPQSSLQKYRLTSLGRAIRGRSPAGDGSA